MSLNELAERLTALECEVDQLKKRLPERPRNDAWEETVGMFDGDEFFREMANEGRKYREMLRETDTE